jgi:cytochrome oxidase Cu insertion factor (SCO1/SenC/PrrC family)
MTATDATKCDREKATILGIERAPISPTVRESRMENLNSMKPDSSSQNSRPTAFLRLSAAAFPVATAAVSVNQMHADETCPPPYLARIEGQPKQVCERQIAELTHDRITVTSFIYTRCSAAKACPMATGVSTQLHGESAADPSLAKRLRLASMSFDSVNDTPERVAAHSELVASPTNAAPWHFVTTQSRSELHPILAAYGQAVDQKQNPSNPTGPLNHMLRIFRVDATGNIRNIYSSGTLDLRLVLADVKTLMLEQTRPHGADGEAYHYHASERSAQ